MAVEKLIEGYRKQDYKEYIQEITQKLEKVNFKLYRYISISDLDSNIKQNLLHEKQYGFKSVLNNYIYHNKPSFFNDPYDCVFGIGLNAFFREILGCFVEIRDINKVFSIDKTYHDIDELIDDVNKMKIADEIKEYVVFILREIEKLINNPDFTLDNAMQKFTVKMMNSPHQYFKFLKPFLADKLDEETLSNQMKMLANQVGQEKIVNSGLNPINPNFNTFKELIDSSGLPGDAEMIKNKLNDSINDFNNKIFSFIDEKIGVASLTTSYNNPLMWSHYGDSHKGICIEYDFRDVIKNEDIKIFLDEIIYAEQRVTIDSNLLDNIDLNNIESNGKLDILRFFIKGLFTKHKIWEYETEWRSIILIDEVNNYSRELRLNNISAIYLGNKMDKDTMNEVVSLLIDLNIPIYKMINEISEYKMNPVKIK